MNHQREILDENPLKREEKERKKKGNARPKGNEKGEFIGGHGEKKRVTQRIWIVISSLICSDHILLDWIQT